MEKIFDLLQGKKSVCEKCGSKEMLEKVMVSSFSLSNVRYMTLCPACRMMEKAKKY